MAGKHCTLWVLKSYMYVWFYRERLSIKIEMHLPRWLEDWSNWFGKHEDANGFLKKISFFRSVFFVCQNEKKKSAKIRLNAPNQKPTLLIVYLRGLFQIPWNYLLPTLDVIVYCIVKKLNLWILNYKEYSKGLQNM